MIWRAGNNYGYNNNAGTLATYNATYCDWTINDGSASLEDTYYIVSKRANGTADGAIIIMATGVFDAWSTGVGYTDRYSNLFRIEAVDVETGIEEVKSENANVKGIYDLQGRKIERISKPGVYIVDGVKRLVK